jgi:hypothetical protein
MEALINNMEGPIIYLKNAVFWYVAKCPLVRTDVSEERIGYVISVERISELGKTAAVTSNWQ